MMQQLSREFLEEVWKIAKNKLPGWVYLSLLKDSRSRAGGRAAHRIDEPSALEKLALGEIRPRVLREVDDQELGAVWLRLNQWYQNAKRRKRPIEDIVNAAAWAVAELKRRGIDLESSALVGEVENLAEASSLKKFEQRAGKLPGELVLVRDFLCVVGSAAKGKEEPDDIDLLVRAQLDGGAYKLESQNVVLPVRNVLDPNKDGALHWIDSAQGVHGDHIPLYDLVMRRRDRLGVEVVKSGPFRVDLGCGDKKPEGYFGIDKEEGPEVDKVHDLEKGIPLDDETADEIRAFHVLEHLENKQAIMAEIHRVLKPGGRFVFEVPSTKGDGAFAHPDHKSFWNLSAFKFWTDPKVTEDRPRFEATELEEKKTGDLVYVKGILTKPEEVKKAIEPFGKFTPPKPQLAGFTELFEVDELWRWAEKRIPVAIEPKLNGFRAIASRRGDRVGIWFEGQPGKNIADRLPGVAEQLRKIPGDWVLDVDVGIERKGKRLPRIDLATLNSERPELQDGDRIVITAFDIPYLGESLTGLEFGDRREILEKKIRGKLPIPPLRWADSLEQIRAAVRWAFKQDRSEGAMAKAQASKYKEGTITDWAKLKRIAELKVIVLDSKEANGARNYFGGLLPGDSDWENRTELGGEEYINLGASFNTSIKAKPGDILTVEILELIPDEEKKRLSWLGARVIDVDSSRKSPYFANQALDIAQRAQVLQKALRMVPSSGPKGALVGFVGASPGRVEIARGDPFVGPSRETFEGKYLEPLGLTRDQVMITNISPELLTDDAGRVRQPSPEEAKTRFRRWIVGELQRLKPEIVVALGGVARDCLKAVGAPVDFTLPHPSALRRFGDKGEVTRKIRQIRERIQKIQKAEIDEEGGETRGARAQRLWEDHWQERIPPSGRGRFVYQHHWRGLDEEEAKQSDRQLLDSDHSMHGDLRFEGPDGLFGWAVFLGTAADNKKAGGDKLLAGKSDLRLAPKLLQPKEWLNVGKKSGGQVMKPGAPGSTGKTWSKFFALDSGTYEIGVVTQNSIEIFLDGSRLAGRYMIIYPRLGGDRVWLIDKPKDQTPRAEAEDLADILSDQKKKDRRFVVWAKPGTKPVKYSTTTGEPIGKELYAPILKADRSKHIVYAAVVDPYGKSGTQPDAHEDWIPPAHVEEMAHAFLQGPMDMTLEHIEKADAKIVESWVEQYPSPEDYRAAMLGLPHKVYRKPFGSDVIHSGSWAVGAWLSDELWEKYEDREINGFSPGGVGLRKPIKQSEMPQIEFVDLVAGGRK
ncbi:MAG: methyltransferase domain-containing protein [Nitrospinaceae bacterium]|nr:methyltransferase domain-containing protein [Deltaproteobacteria bacterium]NIY14235.1 methyltransferase domain-containing protein [Nitrospinaceae bacterium]